MRLIKFLVVLFFVFFMFVSGVSASNLFNAYTVFVEYDEGDYTLLDVDTGLVWDSLSQDMARTYYELNPKMSPEDVFYSYKLKHDSVDAPVLREDSFYVHNKIYVTPPENCFDEEADLIPDECMNYFEQEQFVFSLSVPYVPRGEVITLFNEKKEEVLTIDVSQFAEYCGDGVCNSGETFYSCPLDCKEEPEEFKNNFLANNYDIHSSKEFKVYYTPNKCEEDLSNMNCLEELGSISNFFSKEKTDMVFNEARGSFNFFFQEDSNIVLENDYETRISNDEFKISFDSLRTFSSVTKQFEYEGETCTEEFNPYNNLNPLERNC